MTTSDIAYKIGKLGSNSYYSIVALQLSLNVEEELVKPLLHHGSQTGHDLATSSWDRKFIDDLAEVSLVRN